MNKKTLFIIICGLTSSISWANDLSLSASLDSSTQVSVESKNTLQTNETSLKASAQETASAQPVTSSATPASPSQDEETISDSSNTELTSTEPASVDVETKNTVSLATNGLSTINTQKDEVLSQTKESSEKLTTSAQENLSGLTGKTSDAANQLKDKLDNTNTQANAAVQEQINSVTALEVDKALQTSVNQLLDTQVEGSISNTINNTVQASVDDTIESTITNTIENTVDSSITTALTDSLNLSN